MTKTRSMTRLSALSSASRRKRRGRRGRRGHGPALHKTRSNARWNHSSVGRARRQSELLLEKLLIDTCVVMRLDFPGEPWAKASVPSTTLRKLVSESRPLVPLKVLEELAINSKEAKVLTVDDEEGKPMHTVEQRRLYLQNQGYTFLEEDYSKYISPANQLKIGTTCFNDRLICAQAIDHGLTIVTSDEKMWRCAAVPTIFD